MRFLGLCLMSAALCFGCGNDTDHPEGTDGPWDPNIVDASVTVDASGEDPGQDGSLEEDDGWQCPAPDPCDPVEGEGCDSSAVCVVGPEEPMCASSAGEGAAGEGCDDFGDCGMGLACFATRDGGAVCDRLCCEDAQCAVGERCGAGLTAAGASLGFGRCHPVDDPCDVLDPERTCEPGEACYIVSLTGTEACRRPGSQRVDEPCAHVSDCAPGLACRGLTSSTCKRLCPLETPDACPSDEGECLVQPGLPEGIGLCRTVDLVSQTESW